MILLMEYGRPGMLLMDWKMSGISEYSSNNEPLGRPRQCSICMRQEDFEDMRIISVIQLVSKQKNVNSSKLNQCHGPQLRHLSYVNITDLSVGQSRIHLQEYDYFKDICRSLHFWVVENILPNQEKELNLLMSPENKDDGNIFTVFKIRKLQPNVPIIQRKFTLELILEEKINVFGPQLISQVLCHFLIFTVANLMLQSL